MKCFACQREIPGEAVFCPFCREPQGFDQSLIDFARAGDQDAISELYRRTYENVYYTVRALIRDEDTVLDLVQDTFVKAFENLDKLHDPNKFRAWVKRIGHNLAVDYTRRSRTLLFSQMSEEDEETVLSFPDEREENLPEVALDRRETTRLVNEILGSLSEDQRQVVGMFYYEQRSVREIARELGVSENTVKSRLFQGRKKIETRVRALEAQGTRLYSLSPVAFLLLLLRNQENFIPAMPADGILEGVLGELGQSLASSAGSAASAATQGTLRAAGQSALGAGAKATAAAAGKGLAAKAVAIALSAAVLVGGGVYAVHEITQSRAPEPETVEIVAENPWSAAPVETEEVWSEAPEEPAPAPREELDPALAAAYLRQLRSREEDILCFERRCGGEGVASVALCDVTGDGVPELLYATSQEGAGGAFLWIYRYENGEAVKCGQFTWEAEAGQERLACLFQTEGEPNLYAEYTDPSGGAWADRVLRFDPDGAGGLRQTPLAREQSFASGAYPEYFFDGMAYSETEYRALMTSFYSRVSRVLIFDLQSVLEDRVDSRLAAFPGHGLSYWEAEAFLGG